MKNLNLTVLDRREWECKDENGRMTLIKTDFGSAPELLLKFVRYRCNMSSKNLCGTALCSRWKNGINCMNAWSSCCGESFTYAKTDSTILLLLFLLCFVYELFFVFVFLFGLFLLLLLLFLFFLNCEAQDMLRFFRNFSLNTITVVTLSKKRILYVLAKQMENAHGGINFIAKLEPVGLQLC